MWSDWLVFLTLVFSLFGLWQKRRRGLWKPPDGRDWGGNWILFWWTMHSKFLIQLSVDDLCCYLTWGQTIVDVIKIMVTSFKRSHAYIVILRDPNPAAGHCRPTSPPETPGSLQASLGHLLWGYCSFLLGPAAHKVLSVSSKSLFPQSYVGSGGSRVGLMVTSSKRAHAVPRSTAPRALAPSAVHWWPIPPQSSSVQFTCSVMSDSLWAHGPQHTRPPCPSPTPRVYPNSCPLNQWCHPTILSSIVPSPSAFNLSQHRGLFKWVSS